MLPLKCVICNYLMIFHAINTKHPFFIDNFKTTILYFICMNETEEKMNNPICNNANLNPMQAKMIIKSKLRENFLSGFQKQVHMYKFMNLLGVINKKLEYFFGLKVSYQSFIFKNTDRSNLDKHSTIAGFHDDETTTTLYRLITRAHAIRRCSDIYTSCKCIISSWGYLHDFCPVIL